MVHDVYYRFLDYYFSITIHTSLKENVWLGFLTYFFFVCMCFVYFTHITVTFIVLPSYNLLNRTCTPTEYFIERWCTNNLFLLNFFFFFFSQMMICLLNRLQSSSSRLCSDSRMTSVFKHRKEKWANILCCDFRFKFWQLELLI